MNIIVKNSQLNKETIESLNTLIELDINASCAFRLTRIIKEISSIVDDKIKMERRIIDKWIQKDENGEPTKVKNSEGEFVPDAINITNTSEFSKEMQELQSVEIPLNHEKINFEDLNLKSAKVKDLIKLEFLFN